MTTNTKEVLLAAKALLQNVGWCQNAYTTYDKQYNPTAYCLSGAVCCVDGAYFTIQDEAISCLRSMLENKPLIVNWNDQPGRTKEEVLALLDKAIAQCPNE